MRTKDNLVIKELQRKAVISLSLSLSVYLCCVVVKFKPSEIVALVPSI